MWVIVGDTYATSSGPLGQLDPRNVPVYDTVVWSEVLKSGVGRE